MDFIKNSSLFFNQKSIKLLRLSFFVLLIFSYNNALCKLYGETDKLKIIDPSNYVGKKLKEWPVRFLVKRTKHLNIFWDSSANCLNLNDFSEVVPKVDEAKAIQKHVELVIEPLISQLNSRMHKILPDWTSQVSQELFPVDILIELETPIECAGADIYSSLNVFNGENQHDITLKVRPVMSLGTQFLHGEEKSLATIKMHELGHLMARTLGVPKLRGDGIIQQSLLEETFADFIGSYANNFTPFIGEGMGERIINMMEKKNNSSTSSLLEKGMAEAALLAASNRALRDLSKPRPAWEAYRLTEAHNVSSVINHLTYNFSRLINADFIAKSFLQTFIVDKWAVMDVDLNVFVKKWTDRLMLLVPNEKEKIQSTLNVFGWRAPQISPTVSLLSKVTAQGNQGYKLIFSGLTPVKPYLGEMTVPHINYTVFYKNKIIGWFTDIGRPAFLQLKRVEKCDYTNSPEHACICNIDVEKIELQAVFLGQKNEIMKTPRQSVSLSEISQSACFEAYPGIE